MAYEKTEWKPRRGANLNRFEKGQETTKSVILHNTPSRVDEAGTPISVDNMNHIEQGIEDAHNLIAAEEQARQTAVAAEAALRNTAVAAEAALRNTAVTAEAALRSDADLAIHGILNNLIGNVYTGFTGTHIQTTVESGNVIKAVLLAGSISETELSYALVAKLNSKLNLSGGTMTGKITMDSAAVPANLSDLADNDLVPKSLVQAAIADAVSGLQGGGGGGQVIPGEPTAAASVSGNEAAGAATVVVAAAEVAAAIYTGLAPANIVANRQAMITASANGFPLGSRIACAVRNGNSVSVSSVLLSVGAVRSVFRRKNIPNWGTSDYIINAPGIVSAIRTSPYLFFAPYADENILTLSYGANVAAFDAVPGRWMVVQQGVFIDNNNGCLQMQAFTIFERVA